MISLGAASRAAGVEPSGSANPSLATGARHWKTWPVFTRQQLVGLDIERCESDHMHENGPKSLPTFVKVRVARRELRTRCIFMYGRHSAKNYVGTVGTELIMSNEVNLDDASLASFSQPAKERLRAATLDYLEGLIAESHRLEASMNSDSGPTEITQGMVNDAVTFKKRLPARKKWTFWRVVTRISASILPLLVGLFFNSEKLNEGNNLAFFAIFIALTAIAVAASVFMDE